MIGYEDKTVYKYHSKYHNPKKWLYVPKTGVGVANFTRPFLAKLPKVIFQKHLLLIEQTFAVIFQHTEILYNRTYTHTQKHLFSVPKKH